MQVGTSGAGGAPGEPGFERTTPSSVAIQNMRTPVPLKFCGAELATNVVLVDPAAAANPAAKKLYPSFFPELTAPSRMQACAGSGVHPATGPPRLARSGANPTSAKLLLYVISAVEICRTVCTADASLAAIFERIKFGTA